MKIAIVGATGMVGRVMIEVLAQSNLAVKTLIPVASEKSQGQEVAFRGKTYRMQTLEEALDAQPDIALFSAGAKVSRQYAPLFTAQQCYVIDNSSAWRMDANVPLVVPEINANSIDAKQYIIANPNCSTIQLLMAVAPLHQSFEVERMVISTYQSVSGSGAVAVQQLESERQGKQPTAMAYPHPIDMNVLPHGGDFLPNGYTTEEMKLVNESRKILATPDLKVTATVVRVPVLGGHSESVNLQFKKAFDLDTVKQLLLAMPGVELIDNPAENAYPMPLYAQGKPQVFVGRLRRDESCENALNLWVVSDNLYKGAAYNAVQIAEKIIMGNG